jgi:hypothetical protein
MTLDQLLRRWATRARRAVVGPGADHDPIAVVEPASSTAPDPGARDRASVPPTGPSLRSRMAQGAQFASAFVLTLSLIAIGFALLSARLAMVEPDWSVAAEPSSAVPYSIAAGAAALNLVSADDAYKDGFFIMPGRRQARLRAFQIGAASAVGAFATSRDERRPRSDPDLAAAAGELASLALDDDLEMGDLIAGREALARFGDRAGDGRARFAATPEGMSALALACQTAALAHTAELASRVQSGRSWLIDADAEASFYRARGNAYGWRLVLSAFGRDMASNALARAEPEWSELVAATEDAASYQPLFVLNGPQQSSAAPNHLAELTVKLTRVSAAAEQLANKIRSRPSLPD